MKSPGNLRLKVLFKQQLFNEPIASSAIKVESLPTATPEPQAKAGMNTLTKTAIGASVGAVSASLLIIVGLFVWVLKRTKKRRRIMEEEASIKTDGVETTNPAELEQPKARTTELEQPKKSRVMRRR